MLTVEYVLPEHWAPTLINHDSTGNEPRDTAAIAAWLTAHPNLGDALDCSDEPFLTDFHGAECGKCHCLIYTFPIRD